MSKAGRRAQRRERGIRWRNRCGALAAALAAATLLVGQGQPESGKLDSDRLLAIAKNAELGDDERGAALDALGRSDDAPAEQVRAVALGLIRDRAESTFVRAKAVFAMHSARYANEQVWRELEKRILDEKETDRIFQRDCLNILGTTVPLGRLKRLLARPEVHHNPYYAFRIDVATALSALDVREGFALDILCGYLVDMDPADRKFQVRQEAWLSLWTLTGTAHGAPQGLEGAPTRIRDKRKARGLLWRSSFLRPGVRPSDVVALRKVTPDLERMRAAGAAYRNQREALVQAWAHERRDEAAVVRTKCKYYYDKAKFYELVTKKSPESLDDLAAPLRPGEENFMGPVEKDPWGHPYVLRHDGKKIRILSFGEDGLEGTADDIKYPPSD